MFHVKHFKTIVHQAAGSIFCVERLMDFNRAAVGSIVRRGRFSKKRREQVSLNARRRRCAWTTAGAEVSRQGRDGRAQ